MAQSCSTTGDLKDVSTHFRFGQNWQEYSALIDEKRIEEAGHQLRRLLGTSTLKGKSFLDIGCGSGLHSVAAIDLGAKRVVGIDIDPDSVRTTRSVVRRFRAGASFEARQASVFELDAAGFGTFDYVYSWGVLHHTGAMWEAIDCAARAVGEAGHLALALYRKTPLCPLWRLEKRTYKSSPRWAQAVARGAYVSVVEVGRAIARRSIATPRRGMEYWTDVHDWLGGYPYESVSSDELVSFLAEREFMLERSFLRPKQNLTDRFVTGCDEWLFRRHQAAGGAAS